MTRVRTSERGSALIEVAVALPVVVAIMFFTADFSRVYFTSIELSNAARAAAQFGSRSQANSLNSSGIQNAGTGATNLTGVSVSSSTRCYCEKDDGTSRGSALACTSTCSSGFHLAVYVDTTATKTFSAVSRLPGIPTSVALTRKASMRVLN